VRVLISAAANFLRGLYRHRTLVATMAVQEIRNRYVGTMAGVVWSVVNPLAMIVVYTFVFSKMLRAQPVGDVPYLVYFMAGLVPWLTFSETLLTGTNSISNYAYLAKKMVFPTEIVPVVVLVANLITHGILLGILAIIIAANRVSFSPWNLQVVYYLLALSVFTIGLSWLLSSLSVFLRDTGMIVGVALNIWMWVTPVIWLTDWLPPGYAPWIVLNPMYYIVDGYRRTFVYAQPFWENYGLGLYFWGVSLFFLFVGASVFRKLKPDFAEAL
jgi:lipopolysaccharide transport system permease protein/teichoic acid transport system permease protein